MRVRIKKGIKIISLFLLTVVVVILLLIVGIYYYMNVQGNILDRIKRNEGFLRSFFNTEAFDIKRNSWDYDTYDFIGFLTIKYKKEKLIENCSIGIKFIKDSDLIEIKNIRILSENENLSLKINYDYKNKVIIYEPIKIFVGSNDIESVNDKERIEKYLKQYSITKDDIKKYQEYALYDVVVKTWVEGNGGNYEREKKKLQECTIVDKTYDYDDVGVDNG